MTRINDGELAGIRKRVEEDRGCFQASDRFQLLAEVDRLRTGMRLAKEWRHAPVCLQMKGCEYCKARDAFISWLEEGENGAHQR